MKNIAIILLIVFIVCMANYVWLSKDHSIVSWDWAVHGNTSYQTNVLYEELKELSVAKKVKYIVDKLYYGKTSYYPPLYYSASIIPRKLLGEGKNSISSTNMVFVLFLFLGLFYAFRLHSKDITAFIYSSIACMGYSTLISLSREIMLDFSSAATMLCALSLMVYSDYFRKKISSICFGVFVGISMLCKWNIVYIVFPVAIIVFFSKGIYRDKNRLLNLFLGSFVAILICAPWYIRNLDNLILQSKKYPHSPMSFIPLSLSNFVNVVNRYKILYKTNIPLVALSAFSVLFIVFGRENRKKYIVFILAYFFAVFFWLFLPPVPLYRSAIIVLPINAIFIGLMLRDLIKILNAQKLWFKNIVVFLYTIFCLLPLICNMGYGEGAIPIFLRGNSQNFTPESRIWGVESIAEEIVKDWGSKKGKASVFMLCDYDTTGVYGLDIHSFAFQLQANKGLDCVLSYGEDITRDYDYLIIVDKDNVGSVVKNKNLEIIKEVSTLVREYVLRDKQKGPMGRVFQNEFSRLLLYKNVFLKRSNVCIDLAGSKVEKMIYSKEYKTLYPEFYNEKSGFSVSIESPQESIEKAYCVVRTYVVYPDNYIKINMPNGREVVLRGGYKEKRKAFFFDVADILRKNKKVVLSGELFTGSAASKELFDSRIEGIELFYE